MRLFNLTRNDFVDFDEAYQFIIAADSEADAREAAAERCGYEGSHVWLTSATCEFLGLTNGTTETSVICRAFNAG